MLRCAVVERSSHARGLAVAGCAVVLAALAGACGQASDPPMLGGTGGTADAGDDGAGGGLSVYDAGPPPCNVGIDGGVCACVDQPLVLDPPTIYFVLDRSGSMSESGKWSTVQQVIFGVIVGLGPRADFGVTVFPDPSQDGCSVGREVMPTMGGDPYPGQPGPTAFAFLQLLGRIDAAGGTPTAATLRTLAPVLAKRPGKTYVVLATDGGPNCDGDASCTAAACTDNIEAAQGCPPGGPPNCCTDPSYGGGLACLDSQPTIDAVAALAGAGVPVYVIGLPTTPGQPEVQAYADLLDQLAQAGGTARAGEPQYYAVNTTDATALRAALASIAARITGTCTLTLDQTPPDPGLVNVFFDGRPVPQAGPNGWTLSGATVTILGTSCQAILSGQVLDVRVVAGCPTVTQ
jgi:hypothetical protein